MLGAGAGIVFALGLFALVGDFVTDDAAISLRYARHLAGGSGIVWNVGEDPVEGYTNFLHVVLGAAAFWAGLPALTMLRVLNQTSVLALCVVVYLLARDAVRSKGWAVTAAAIVGMHAPLAYWASSGLETGLYTLLVYACLLMWRRAANGSWWPALPFLLAALTRFEGPVVFAIVVGVLCVETINGRNAQALRGHAYWIGGFLVAYAIYFVWRYGYFGHLLANSAYYKQGRSGAAGLVRDFAWQCAPLCVLALFAPFRKLGALGLVLLGLVVAYVAGFWNVRESVSYFHRFFVPVVPALALLAASALDRLWNASVRRVAVRGASLVLCAGAIVMELFHPQTGWSAVHATVRRLNERVSQRVEVAALITARFPATDDVVLGDVGIVGYALPHPIRDLFGLNDERFTHAFGRSYGRYVRVLADRSPAVAVIVSKRVDTLTPVYATERRLVEALGIGRRYQHVATVPSGGAPYHYWLFARDVPRSSVALPSWRAASLSMQVDLLARDASARR